MSSVTTTSGMFHYAKAFNPKSKENNSPKKRWVERGGGPGVKKEKGLPPAPEIDVDRLVGAAIEAYWVPLHLHSSPPILSFAKDIVLYKGHKTTRH